MDLGSRIRNFLQQAGTTINNVGQGISQAVAPVEQSIQNSPFGQGLSKALQNGALGPGVQYLTNPQARQTINTNYINPILNAVPAGIRMSVPYQVASGLSGNGQTPQNQFKDLGTFTRGVGALGMKPFGYALAGALGTASNHANPQQGMEQGIKFGQQVTPISEAVGALPFIKNAGETVKNLIPGESSASNFIGKIAGGLTKGAIKEPLTGAAVGLLTGQDPIATAGQFAKFAPLSGVEGIASTDNAKALADIEHPIADTDREQILKSIDTLKSTNPSEVIQGAPGAETFLRQMAGDYVDKTFAKKAPINDIMNELINRVNVDKGYDLGPALVGKNDVKLPNLKTTSETPFEPTGQLPSKLKAEGNEGLVSPEGQAPEVTANQLLSKRSSQDIVPPNEQPRGFLNTVENVPNASRTVTVPTEKIEPQTYTPLTNNESFGTAQSRIDTQGVDAAHQFVLSNAPYDAEKAATGQLLMKQYAEHIAEPGNYEKFQQVTSSIDNQARTAGQGIQSLSNWDKLSPKTLLSVANTTAEKAGQILPDDFQKQIISRAADIQKMADGSPERAQATQALLKDIATQLPATKGEIFNAYRYMNMLSGPVTVGKIGYGGLFNTLVTRPVDLFAEATTQHAHEAMDSSFQRTISYADIPKWYKNVALGMPDAWQAAVDGWSKGNLDKAFQEGSSGKGTLENLRKENLPGVLTLPGKVHGFVYNYFSSLISGGEQARLMANGVDETTAKEAGQALGDKFTLRSQLGTKDQSKMVEAIDSIGKMATDMQSKPGLVGTAAKWVAPFMKVSTNFVKLGVEHSPLALPDSAVNFLKGAPGADEALAHAMVGSVVAGMGMMMAAKDNVTLAAPTDPKENALFYASGRKPYSVNIPGVGWTPYQYFGPLGLSLMLPAAVKDATTGTNLPKGALDKVIAGATNITKMTIAGTPLPSITDFFSMLSGDTSVNPQTIMADLASQVIPLEAMQKYIAQIIDPVYRKTSGAVQRIESGIPGLKNTLPAYTTPLGQPETRNASDFVAPYPIGKPDNQYEPAFQSRQTTLNSNAIVNEANKNAQDGTTNISGGKQISPNIYQLPSGTFAYQVTDENGQTTINQAKTQTQAQVAVDKNNFTTSGQDSSYLNNILYTKNPDGTISTKKIDLTQPIDYPTLTGDNTMDAKLISSYKSELTSRMSDIMTLYKNGQLSMPDAKDAINTLQGQYDSTKKPKTLSLSKILTMTKPSKMSGMKGLSLKSSGGTKVPMFKAPKMGTFNLKGNSSLKVKAPKLLKLKNLKAIS